MTLDRINQLPPASLDSERGLLCSFCLDPQKVGAMIAERRIGPEHFTSPIHAKMCETMAARWSSGKPIAMRLVMRDMEDGQEGEIYASEILSHISTPRFADEFAETVVEKYCLRQIISQTREINATAWTQEAESGPLLQSLSDLSALATPKAAEMSFRDMLREKLHRIENGEPNVDLILTGIAGLDRDSPLRLGDMPLISGEKKVGKSMLALSIATNVLLAGNAVLYFSLEDRAAKVIDRLLAGVSRVPLTNHHVRNMSELESQRVNAAFERLVEQKMFIRDDVQDLAPICAIVRQRKAQNPDLRLVVLDYSQLVRCKLQKGANREQEVATVSRTLRLLSIELGVAIILLCQLNKEGDTRESKALEQDATAMWKLIRTEDDESNKRMIVIPFQRNGDSNIAFPVTFFGHIARVENCTDEQQ